MCQEPVVTEIDPRQRNQKDARDGASNSGPRKEIGQKCQKRGNVNQSNANAPIDQLNSAFLVGQARVLGRHHRGEFGFLVGGP